MMLMLQAIHTVHPSYIDIPDNWDIRIHFIDSLLTILWSTILRVKVLIYRCLRTLLNPFPINCIMLIVLYVHFHVWKPCRILYLFRR